MDRVQGGPWGPIKGLRGSWEGVPWGTRARSPAGRSGFVGALEKERGRRAMTGGSGLSASRREGTVTRGRPALGERGCWAERAECGPREEENGPCFGLGQGEGKGGS